MHNTNIITLKAYAAGKVGIFIKNTQQQISKKLNLSLKNKYSEVSTNSK